MLFFCVQHTGIEKVSPADDIDPKYSALLRMAMAEGVESIAYRADIDTKNSMVELKNQIPVIV